MGNVAGRRSTEATWRLLLFAVWVLRRFKGGEQRCCLSLGSAAEAMSALPHSALCLGCWRLQGPAQAALGKGVQRCSTQPAPAPPPCSSAAQEPAVALSRVFAAQRSVSLGKLNSN